MVKKILLPALLCLAFLSLKAQQPDSVRRFIDSALYIMQNHSIFAKDVNWKKVKDSVTILSASARNYVETAPALHYAFNQLNDKHGWLVINDSTYTNPKFKTVTPKFSESIALAARKGPRIYQRLIAKHYAYLSIPFFGGQTVEGMNKFAQQIQDSLCKNINPKIKGIIIDLRLNAGGNMYPMLVGISNVLGDGVISVTRDGMGNITSETALRDGSMTLADTFHIRLAKNCGDLSRLPVAIIIGPLTGSAGENVAVSIRGRDKTIMIGENSAGYTSGNTGYRLPGENNGIVTAMDFLHDRHGREYRDHVAPDIYITGDNFFETSKDKKIEAAIKWFEKK